MKEKLLLGLVVLIFDVLSVRWFFWLGDSDTSSLINHNLEPPPSLGQLDTCNRFSRPELWSPTRPSSNSLTFISLVEAKGVAGLGKAGGEGTGGADKAGTQVPPEVYNALTYAGTAFLFTLSVPLILYGLNKLLNKIEDCFGCGPASKKKKLSERQLENQRLCVKVIGNNNDSKFDDSSLVSRNLRQQYHSHGSLTKKQSKQYLHQHNLQYEPSMVNNQSSRVASFPLNKDSHSGGSSGSHNNQNGSRQNSPAVPMTDSSTAAAKILLDSNQQDYTEEPPTVPVSSSLAAATYQSNYQRSAPYIISPPHM